MSRRSKRLEQLAIVHPNAGGLDIGAQEIWGCVPPNRQGETVKAFATFTPGLHRLADWLVACGVDTVAMESTGVYWIPIFEMLEARGLKVDLVNAQHIKNVPGRKSDYADCQWIQKLHAVGLLSGSFRPDAERCSLRAYLRHRAQLIEHRSPHVLHIQKALHQMNIQLPHVLTDITGDTGMAILRAIIAGNAMVSSWRNYAIPAVNHLKSGFHPKNRGGWVFLTFREAFLCLDKPEQTGVLVIVIPTGTLDSSAHLVKMSTTIFSAQFGFTERMLLAN